MSGGASVVSGGGASVVVSGGGTAGQKSSDAGIRSPYMMVE